jgi:hypothetical protein
MRSEIRLTIVFEKRIFFSFSELIRVRVNCSNCNCSNLDCSTVFIEISTARHEKWHLLDTQKDLKTQPNLT